MSRKRKNPKDAEWSEDQVKMFTKDGELNWKEREVAWLAELARVDLPDGGVDDSESIDWSYVEARCSDNLHRVIQSKEAAGMGLIRWNKKAQFGQYRQLLRKALDGGYRPPDWEGRKRARIDSVGTKTDDKSHCHHAKQKGETFPPFTMACARPLFHVGEEVMAAWFDEGGASWYGGKILSYVTIQTDERYGERRAYMIKFEDGDVTKEPLEDTWVFSREDYDLDREVDDNERKLKGIDNLLQKESVDPYALTRGYYTTKLTGCKRFTSLGDAMRAYDKEVIRQKGDFVRRHELNLPDEWLK